MVSDATYDMYLYIFTFSPFVIIPLLILLVRGIRFVFLRIRRRSYIDPRTRAPFRQNRHETFRIYLKTSLAGRAWMIFQIIITFGSVILYVIETYHTTTWSLVIPELVFTGFFIIDYVVQFYAAHDRLKFFFNGYSLIDMITIAPVIVPFIVAVAVGRLRDVPTLLLALRALRALRILRTYRLLSFSQTDAQRQVLILLLTFILVVFLSAAFINAIEEWTLQTNRNTIPSLIYFHDALYFIVITFSTVGFGDLKPSSIYTRLLVMTMILLFMILIPIQTSRLIYYINQRNPLASKTYHRPKDKIHVILTGVISYSGAITFMREFFSGFHCRDRVEIVILSEKTADERLKALLRHPYYRHRVRMLMGSPLSLYDLERCQATKAKAVFIMSGHGRYTSSFEERDTAIAMYAIAVKHHYPHVLTFVMTGDTVAKELAQDNYSDRVLCMDEIKMSIIARNCIAPGFSTFLTNLLRTYRPLKDKELVPWMREYSYGSSHQIYAFLIPSSLVRRNFYDVVADLFDLFAVCLIGVETRSVELDTRIMTINPSMDYKMHQGDVGFIICRDFPTFLEQLQDHFPHDEGFREGPYGRMSSMISAASDESQGNVSILDFLRAGRKRHRKSSQPNNFLTVQDVFSPTTTQMFTDTKRETATLPAQTMFASRPSSAFATRQPSLASIDENSVGYYVCPRQLLKDCTLEIVDFDHHIILTGSLRGIRNFMLPLRQENVQRVIPVVLLSDTPPSREIWETISTFPDIYYIKGSALKFNELKKAGVARCDKIVVLLPEHGTQDELLADSESVFIMKFVESRFSNVYSMVELAHGPNISLLSQKDNWQLGRMTTIKDLLDDYALSFSERMYLLDNTTKNYNPKTHEGMWRELFTNQKYQREMTLSGINPFPSYHFEPYYISGQVFMSSLLDSLLCQMYYHPYILKLVNVLVSAFGDRAPATTQVVQIPLPPGYDGRTYKELMTFFLGKGMIPVGLYRCPGTFGSPIWYVYTNCRGETTLSARDRVFVLVNDARDSFNSVEFSTTTSAESMDSSSERKGSA